jgi:hypothetical protein
MSAASQVEKAFWAVLGHFGRKTRLAQRELVRQHNETDELISRLQGRVATLRSTVASMAVFWGRSYVGLRETFEVGCRQHLEELERMRADLDLAVKGAADLRGVNLRAALARAQALQAQVDELQREIIERERFWSVEAEWTLSLLGERKPSLWPPEPRREMAKAA